MAKHTRKLPTRVYDGKRDVFDDHLVTALDPHTPTAVRFALDAQRSGVAALISTLIAAGAGIACYATGVATSGAEWGIAAALLVALFGARHAYVWQRGGRGRWTASANAFFLDEDTGPATHALGEALQARREIRDVARGPAGHHITDQLLETIETVCYEATRARNRRYVAGDAAYDVVGDGPHAEIIRERYRSEADAELERVRRYRDALSAVAAAANEAHHEYVLLSEAGHLVDGNGNDVIEVQLRDTLAAAVADLTAVAAAANEINSGTTAMIEVEAAVESNLKNATAITAAAAALEATNDN